MKTMKSVLVGALSVVVMFGGIEVASAVTGNKQFKVCADKTTGLLRYTTKSCKRTDTALILNSRGLPGPTGPAGAKGESGPKGDTGAPGSSGSTITELSICGADGTSLCKEGVQGPGGGTIFFVDYHDIYQGFNYLEVAPQGWGNGIAVNEGGVTGETTGTSTNDPLMTWCSDASTLLGLDAFAKSAVGAGRSNTTSADAVCTGGAIQAVSDYTSVVGAKSDWFMPSIGEAWLMYTRMLQMGLGNFPYSRYWTSSEGSSTEIQIQYTSYGGYQELIAKNSFNWVRPIRSF